MLQRQRELESEFGRTPTSIELANAMGLGLERVEFLLQLAHPPESLDLLMEEDADAVAKESARLHQTTESEELSNLWDWSARDTVEKVLNSLSTREAQVIRLRFGIGGNHAHTLEQVGHYFGVTRERIRQIEARALDKLRRPKNAYRLRELI